uniref:Uncharacterized protein n=1 Tax=Arundo donax TaxID=35708 RepID=A0A0A9ASX8_ARUDO
MSQPNKEQHRHTEKSQIAKMVNSLVTENIKSKRLIPAIPARCGLFSFLSWLFSVSCYPGPPHDR